MILSRLQIHRALPTAILLLASAIPTHAQTQTYGVFCASNKIEVDSRSEEQMRLARGSGICQFSRFNFRMDAEGFAKKNFGQIGGKCACK